MTPARPAAPPRPAAAPPTVLFVSLAAGLGGSVRSLLIALEALEGRCRRVVARRPDTTLARTLDRAAAGDEVVDLPAPRRRSRLADAWRLARWARRHRRELTAIHANGLSELLVAGLAARVAGTPVVVWVHEWETSTGQRWSARVLGRVVDVRWATVSAANRSMLHAAHLAVGRPVRVIPNPVEAAVEPDGGSTPRGDRGAGSAPTVGFLGTPATYKGFDLLPAVVDRVAALTPEVRWHVWAGPETLAPEVFAALRSRSDRVTLHPKTTDVDQAYATCDVVFCPSRAESFGRVAAEALAWGRPVVASDLPALREVVGDAGILVPPGDVDAAAAALADLATDPTRRASLAAAGLDRVHRFAPGPVADALLACYRGEPAPPPLPEPPGRSGAPDAGGLPARALVVSHDAARAGAPTVALRVAEALAAAGVEVHVALRHGGPLAPDLARVATSVGREPLARVRSVLRRRPRLRPAVHRLDVHLAARILTRSAPDLVWCNSVMTANHLRAAVDAGVPAVLHGHESGPEVGPVLGRYGLAGGGSQPGTPVHLVAAGPGAAERLAQAWATAPAAVRVIESAVDVAALRPRGAAPPAPGTEPARPDGGGLVVACGRASRDKGVDLWLAAAAQVVRDRPATRFVWIGADGHEHTEPAAALGLGHVVRFTGELADPLPLVARADVFTHPSRLDTFPLVVLEAMALGRAVVAFDSGGAAHQLAEAGVVVAPGDVDALAAAIGELLDDGERRAALGRAAERRVRDHFDVGRFDRAVVDVARTTAGDRPPSPSDVVRRHGHRAVGFSGPAGG